jgi:hypothetical protein
MQSNRRNHQLIPGYDRPFPLRSFHWARGFVCIAAITVVTGAARPIQFPSTQTPSPNYDKPWLAPEANRLPGTNDQMRMREQKLKRQNFDLANSIRKKQIADDSSKLLTLAIALKAEVGDAGGQVAVTPDAVRKVDGIEKLAQSVKHKMELEVGTN